ncbi:MAG: hypothetical protein ACLQDY_11020 [Streptosporangiaceae bacterium]
MRPSEVVLGVQVSRDRKHTSVAAAGYRGRSYLGNMIELELAAYIARAADEPPPRAWSLTERLSEKLRPAPAVVTDAAVAVISRLGDERRTIGVVIDPRSPASTLLRPLREAGIMNITEVTAAGLAAAHGNFVDELTAGRLGIIDHPALKEAVRWAAERDLAGGKALDRRGGADSGPADAAEMAVWGLLGGCRNVRPFVLVGGSDDGASAGEPRNDREARDQFLARLGYRTTP